jgi:hypothetical protein
MGDMGIMGAMFRAEATRLQFKGVTVAGVQLNT